MIISSYWPIPTQDPTTGQLWNKVLHHIRRWNYTCSPLEFCQRFINEHLVKHLKKHRSNTAILVGDLNATWNPSAKGGCHSGFQSWADSTGWSNPLHSLSLHHSNPIYTHWIGHHILDGVSHTGYSWIDHLLLHRHGGLKLAEGGTDSGEAWIFISDHRPIWAEIIVPGVHFDTGPVADPFQAPPLRRPPSQNKTMLANYQAKVERKVLQLSSALDPCEKLEAIAEISVGCCPKTKTKTSFYNSTRYRGGWSPQLLAGLAALTAVARMRQHSTGENKRRRWLTHMDIATGIKEICDEWEKKLNKIPWADADERYRAFTLGKGPHTWRTLTISEYGQLSTKLRETEKQIKGRLHGRQRRDMRMDINKATAAREKSRIQGRLTSVIRSICGTHVEQYSLHQLLLPTGETTTDPLAIHDKHTAHWRHWFSSPESPNFFTHHEIDWSYPQDSKDDFMEFPNHLCIPLNIRENIWNALTVPKYDGPAVKEKLAEATTRPVTIEDLKAAISKASSTSVPGPSGLSYLMMKTWTPKVLQEAFDAMTMIWETGQIPLWWKKKWLCPKAKVDPALATLEDLRPISLLETTRKIWMGIIVGRIVSVWETDNVLADGQYGFRKNKGCEAPTIQVLNALEEAEEAGTEIHGSSWDIKRAFDSVSKPILQMSWQRLGVPRHIAKYIVDLDKECLTIPLTPHAMRIMSNNGLSSFNLRPSS